MGGSTSSQRVSVVPLTTDGGGDDGGGDRDGGGDGDERGAVLVASPAHPRSLVAKQWRRAVAVDEVGKGGEGQQVEEECATVATLTFDEDITALACLSSATEVKETSLIAIGDIGGRVHVVEFNTHRRL